MATMEETRDYMRAVDLRYDVAFPIFHAPKRWKKGKIAPTMLAEFVAAFLNWKEWHEETAIKWMFGFDEIQAFDKTLSTLVRRSEKLGLDTNGIPPGRVGDANYPQRDVGTADRVLSFAKWGLIAYAAVNLVQLIPGKKKG